MEIQRNESGKWNRGGFLSSLNRSFRLSSGKSRLGSSDTKVNESSLNMESVGGLNSSSDCNAALRPLEIVAPRIDSYRFSMANMEETQDADLDAILGELCALDSECDEEISRVSALTLGQRDVVDSTVGCSQRPGCHSKECGDSTPSLARTDSPDNDSAFSDTVSMLSSESSASSSVSSKCKALKLNLQQNQKQDTTFQQKADKIKLALERMREANIKKLFIKAFSVDGSSKSLLVDEKMTCGYVTRLLADKNHVPMEPKWAIVEHLPDLFMERIYEDHEMLVDNLMLWTRESKNKILFAERPDKISLFQTPEKFLPTEDDRGWSQDHDEQSRQVILEEVVGPATLQGPLYLKSDAKKGWKKYHFVLRPSGLYYSPKEKVKSLKELVCLATFDTNEVYIGINWKKKYKSPTDYCFAIKHPRLQQPKSVKFIKFLCADDQPTLERWITAMRIAKHGRQLLDNYRSLVEELTQEDLDHFAQARSCSITSLPSKASAGPPPPPAASSDAGSGRHSRASSSSSSGCMSDGGTASESAFDCEFPMGTIKRKPSMKPNIPLTWMTRQLKEMAEQPHEPPDGGTLTRRRAAHRNIETESIYSGLSGGYEPQYAAGGWSPTELPPPPPPPAAPLSPGLDPLPPPPPPEDLALVDLPLAAEPATPSKCGSIKKVNFADDPVQRSNTDPKRNKKITFNLSAETSPLKPPPPKRNESTRLTSPKKLAESSSNPPTEFLKDLQRVMRKKWQVAQKCKLEPTTTPHEVLGFREYPLSEDYKEASVSMWVQEHYGRRRPPAPPRRSDSTHLTAHLAA